MADITSALRDMNISIESLLQRGEADNGGVFIILTTHETSGMQIEKTLETISKLDRILDDPVLLRIETI